MIKMNLNDMKYVPNPCTNLTRASSSLHASTRTPPSRLKVPCIFCSDGVPQTNLNPDIDHAENQEFRKMLKTLYRNFQMKSDDVPPNSTEVTFPFCDSCKTDVTEIYRQQRVMDEAEKRIGQCLASIEKSVMEMELLKPEGIVKTENCESAKLTDKILEGIRYKLRMRKSLRKAGKPVEEMATPAITYPSSNVVVGGSVIRGQFESAKMKTFQWRDESTGSNNSHENHEIQMTVDVSPTDICPEVEVKTELPETENMDNMFDGVIGNYDENSCTMTISDVRSELGSVNEPPTPAVMQQEREVEGVDVVKREVGSPSFEGRRFNRTRRSVYRVQPKKMKKTFTGRKTRSSSGVLSSAASSIASDGSGESLPLRRRSQRTIEFSCQNCNEKFASKLLVQEHNELVHTKAGKRRTPSPTRIEGLALIRKNRAIVRKSTGGSQNSGSGGRRKYRKLASFWFNDEMRREKMNKRGATANNNCQWKCDLCHSLFSEQSLYTIHMKWHARRKDHGKATPSTSGLRNDVATTVAASVPKEYLYVRDKNGKNVVIGEKVKAGVMGNGIMKVHNNDKAV